MAEIAKEQFVDIAQTIDKISLLSELNLVYIILNAGKTGTKTIAAAGTSTTTKTKESATASSGSSNKQEASPAPSTTFSGSKTRSRYSRAEEFIKKGNFAQAVIELRDRIKEDPLDPITHSLLGYAFLKQKQMGMAKVHAKKSLRI